MILLSDPFLIQLKKKKIPICFLLNEIERKSEYKVFGITLPIRVEIHEESEFVI
jgi:hypothetical protein